MVLWMHQCLQPLLPSAHHVKKPRGVLRPDGQRVKRTSLLLPYELWVSGKVAALRSGRTLREVLLDGLRAEIEKAEGKTRKGQP